MRERSEQKRREAAGEWERQTLHVGTGRRKTVRTRKERAKDSWEGGFEDQHHCTVQCCSGFLPIPQLTSARFHKYFLSSAIRDRPWAGAGDATVDKTHRTLPREVT